MIHSPMPGTCFPCQVPAGTEYTPQWITMPKRASRHHFMRASREGLEPLEGSLLRTSPISAPWQQLATIKATSEAKTIRAGQLLATFIDSSPSKREVGSELHCLPAYRPVQVDWRSLPQARGPKHATATG